MTAITARVEPPAYTKMAASVARDPARIEAWEGSRVVAERRDERGRPVGRGDVAEGGPRREGRGGRGAGKSAVTARSAKATLTAEATGEYAIALRDGFGLASRPEAAEAAGRPARCAARAWPSGASRGSTRRGPTTRCRVGIAAQG